MFAALSLSAGNAGSSINETDTNFGGRDKSNGGDQAVEAPKPAADDADTLISASLMVTTLTPVFCGWF